MIELKSPNWPAAIVFAVLGVLFVVWLKVYLRDKQVWRYDTRAAWLRAFAYFAFAWSLGMASGTVPTILGNPLVLPGQSSSIFWIVYTVLLTVVVFIGYWIIWPIGTLPHGRRVIVPDTVVFGVLWGVSEGLLFGSVWLLAKRFWDGLLGAGTGSDFAICFTTIIVLSVFVGMWHALYWDVHISPEHNIFEWNIRKVLLAHNPNLILGAIYVTAWQNLGIWVALQAFALFGSTLAMPFPSARWPHPVDPTGPALGPQTDEPADLSGQTVVVTGGARGMGAMAAGRLAAQGADVVILDVREELARTTADEISRDTGRTIDVIHVDLASNDSVHQAAEEVLRRYPRIDVLLNNAGIFTEMYQENEAGLELTIATNHVGGFLLTQLLRERLQASKARVIFVSSDAHRQAMSIPWDSVNGTALWKGKERNGQAGFVQYNSSKLLVTAAAMELAERTKGTGMCVNVVAPGALIPTNIYDDASGPIQLLVKYGKPILRTPQKAMITYVYVASSPEVEGASGWYWKDGRPTAESQVAQDQTLRDQVWAWSMQEAGLTLRT